MRAAFHLEMVWKNIAPVYGLLAAACASLHSDTPYSAYRMLRYVWRHTGKRILGAIRAIARVLKNASRQVLGLSDYKRWKSPQGLEAWWDERTRAIAGLVPAGSRVIEFGAGRRQLEKFLPGACTYTPSDLVDRGQGTIICDLNERPLPSLSRIAPEVGVFSGVIEYLRDVPGVAQWLANEGVKTCVVSFDPVPSDLGIMDRYRELSRRRYWGYMNNLTEEDLLRTFGFAGFACMHRQTWTSQIILVFCQSGDSGHRRTQSDFSGPLLVS
jgi:hypothetical protein